MTRPARAHKISLLLVGATVLAVVTTAAHVFAGTPEIHGPVLGAGFEQPVVLEVYAVWHLVSVALALSAYALALGALRRDAASLATAEFVSWMWLAFGLVFVAVDLSLAGPTGLASGPQWTILALTGALGVAGTRTLAGRLEAVPATLSESKDTVSRTHA